MPQLPNARIPELPVSSAPNPGMQFVIYDPLSGLTKNILINFFLPAVTSQNFEWVSNREPDGYDTDEFVTYGGFGWTSLADNNNGNIPTEGGPWWQKINQSPAGFVFWQAGVFTQDVVFVLRALDGFTQLFQLDASVIKPFNSTNFEAEFCQGKWILASERGYIAQEKPGHGFAVNDVLTYKAGAWNKFTAGDRPLLIVKAVVDAGKFIAVVIGDRVKGFAGLIAGTIYYAQADGTFSVIVSDNPIMIAISTTEAILLYSGNTIPEPGPGAYYGAEYATEYD
jgi:hypothetical protein